MAKTLDSKKVDVKQLLLKVTVPRRTGRRRKRGSNEPFVADDSQANNNYNGHALRGMPQSEAKAMLRAMRDNKSDYSVEVAGKIDEAHRFRNTPDFQYATSGNSLMQNLRESIFTTDLASVRDFKFDMSKDLAADQDVGPPPFFTTVKQPYNWSYKQNPYVKTFRDAEGNLRVTNTTVPIKHIRHNIDPDAPFIPSNPPAELAPLQTTPPKIQTAVKQLRTMFEKRPLMQRRVFVNLFVGRQSENELKAAVGYCGYAFTSGPWRDTVIKFGIDPRKDPKYRIYQTVTYQLQNEPGVAADDPGSLIRKVAGKRITVKQARVMHSHIFDGEKFYKDGKVWQACDVTDGVLKDLLENAELRSEPDVSIRYFVSKCRC
jgi:general transcription factor 3C polypeptide 5 (transcription factor C subunit 1)